MIILEESPMTIRNFFEVGESTQEAATHEAFEEMGLRVTDLEPFDG